MTINAITDWILQHPKRYKVCKDYSILDIKAMLLKSCNNGALITVISNDNVIQGVAAFEVSVENKLVHINLILIDTKIPNVFKIMLDTFHKKYTNYDIQAYRNDNLIRYKSSTRLLSLLERFSK